MSVHSESEYVSLLTQYRDLKKKENEIKASQISLREKGAKLLHDDQINENIVTLEDGENWKCGYESKSTSKTDHKLLLEYVGSAKYKEIVTENDSVYLSMRKSAKGKVDTSLLNEKPINDELTIPSVPSGTILS